MVLSLAPFLKELEIQIRKKFSIVNGKNKHVFQTCIQLCCLRMTYMLFWRSSFKKICIFFTNNRTFCSIFFKISCSRQRPTQSSHNLFSRNNFWHIFGGNVINDVSSFSFMTFKKKCQKLYVKKINLDLIWTYKKKKG